MPTLVVFPGSLSPTPSTSSAMRTPDSHSPGPSAFLGQTEQTP
jgi:hypothetical protein